MKVPNPIINSVMRVVAAGSLAWVLAVGGAAAPLTANAETTPAPVAVASEPASAAVEATVAADPSQLATPAAVATVTVVPPAKKLTVKQTIAKVGRAKGLSKSEIAALMWMAKRESNFHPTSKSSSGCYGLFQLSHGMAHGHPWKNPAWNTKRAIRYMKGRYGGVLKAKAFWQSHHWY